MTVVLGEIKVGMIVTTVGLYVAVPSLVTFDLCLGQHMRKIGGLSTSGTAHVIMRKLGIDREYINHMSSVLFIIIIIFLLLLLF